MKKKITNCYVILDKPDPDVTLGVTSQDYLEFSVFLKPGILNSGPQKLLEGHQNFLL